MRILITGGAGFIGSRLSARLQDQHDVVLFDAFHPQVHTPGHPHTRVGTVFPGDVADNDAWDRLFRLHGLPEVIYHLAAETGTGQSLREATRHGSVNVIGTTQLTDALVRHAHEPKQIVLTSSRAVYGEGAWQNAYDGVFYPPPRAGSSLAAREWDPRSPSGSASIPVAHQADEVWARPSNVYAATKLAQEHLLESWCTAFGVPLAILRLQNVYGPGQAVGNSYTGVLTFFARQIASGESVRVYEDGKIVRDFVFVDDVVDALHRVMDHGATEVVRADIGGGRAVDLWEVANTMCELAGVAPPTVTGEYRLGDVRAAFADVQRADKWLGWTPQTSLRSGLAALLEWVPTQLG